MRVEGVDYLDGPIVVNSMEGFKEELGTELFYGLSVNGRKVGKAWWVKAEDGSYPEFDATVDYVLDCYKTMAPSTAFLASLKEQAWDFSLLLFRRRETSQPISNSPLAILASIPPI